MPSIQNPTHSDIHDIVRDAYGRIASGGGGCCGATPNCCGSDSESDSLALSLGYSALELAAIPEGSNLGLSCGNPTALASLKPGETVLDLGSGAGFDIFIAASKVGATGQAIGIDMTHEMVAKARTNAAAFHHRTGLDNVTFHLSHIEQLPLPDASVDVVISNCVLNLSPDQPTVWREIARVLKPGGRVSISDLALLRPLPDSIKSQVAAYVGCIAGASLLADIERMVREAGLVDLTIESHGEAIDAMLDPSNPLHAEILKKLPPGMSPADFVTSALISAYKSHT
ncbi:MAG: arsenite methyltransferase [Holophagaceae bacterium]|nr:arsenite methyltransferase [Holophagaceae bacterium]